MKKIIKINNETIEKIELKNLPVNALEFLMKNWEILSKDGIGVTIHNYDLFLFKPILFDIGKYEYLCVKVIPSNSNSNSFFYETMYIKKNNETSFFPVLYLNPREIKDRSTLNHLINSLNTAHLILSDSSMKIIDNALYIDIYLRKIDTIDDYVEKIKLLRSLKELSGITEEKEREIVNKIKEIYYEFIINVNSNELINVIHETLQEKEVKLTDKIIDAISSRIREISNVEERINVIESIIKKKREKWSLLRDDYINANAVLSVYYHESDNYRKSLDYIESLNEDFVTDQDVFDIIVKTINIMSYKNDEYEILPYIDKIYTIKATNKTIDTSSFFYLLRQREFYGNTLDHMLTIGDFSYFIKRVDKILDSPYYNYLFFRYVSLTDILIKRGYTTDITKLLDKLKEKGYDEIIIEFANYLVDNLLDDESSINIDYALRNSHKFAKILRKLSEYINDAPEMFRFTIENKVKKILELIYGYSNLFHDINDFFEFVASLLSLLRTGQSKFGNERHFHVMAFLDAVNTCDYKKMDNIYKKIDKDTIENIMITAIRIHSLYIKEEIRSKSKARIENLIDTILIDFKILHELDSTPKLDYLVYNLKNGFIDLLEIVSKESVNFDIVKRFLMYNHDISDIKKVGYTISDTLHCNTIEHIYNKIHNFKLFNEEIREIISKYSQEDKDLAEKVIRKIKESSFDSLFDSIFSASIKSVHGDTDRQRLEEIFLYFKEGLSEEKIKRLIKKNNFIYRLRKYVYIVDNRIIVTRAMKNVFNDIENIRKTVDNCIRTDEKLKMILIKYHRAMINYDENKKVTGHINIIIDEISELIDYYESPYLYYVLGNCYYLSSEFKKAKECYDKAIEIYDSNYSFMPNKYFIARCYFNKYSAMVEMKEKKIDIIIPKEIEKNYNEITTWGDKINE